MQGYAHVRWLTLKSAWAWAIAAWCSMAALLLARAITSDGQTVTVAALSFLTATMLLAPLTAALGARRPGCSAWPWFVVLPMVIVLQWPVIWQIWQSRARGPVEIGLPAMAGFITVLLMGFGNYFGTGNTLAAVLIACAAILLMLPVSGWQAVPPDTILIAPALLACATQLIWCRHHDLLQLPVRTRTEATQKIWLLFRDHFGILWARRVMDRLVVFEQRERWRMQLTLDGFTLKDALTNALTDGGQADSEMDSDGQLERPLEVLCWVLRRFADPAWFQQQLREFCPEEVLVERTAGGVERSANGPGV